MEKLMERGRKAVGISFPIYDSPSGHVIRRYLSGEFGPVSSVNPKMASTLYALNRHAHRGMVVDYLAQGVTLICDRYVESNFGHQGAKFDLDEEREAFFKWCERLEYYDMDMPRPSVGILLHVPWEVSKQLLVSRGAIIDGHEGDDHHQQMSEKSYLHLARLYNWTVVECYAGGRIRSANEISIEIFSRLMSLVG